MYPQNVFQCHNAGVSTATPNPYQVKGETKHMAP